MPQVEHGGRSHPCVEAQIPRLSDANGLGRFVVMKCCHCRITRNFRPDDIMGLVGNLHVLALRRCFRCEKCKRKDYIEVRFRMVIAEEMQGYPVCELVEIRTVKRDRIL